MTCALVIGKLKITQFTWYLSILDVFRHLLSLQASQKTPKHHSYVCVISPFCLTSQCACTTNLKFVLLPQNDPDVK